MKRSLKFLFPFIISAVFAGGIVLGWFLNGSHSLRGGEQKLLEVMSIIREEYVDDIDMDSLVEMAIPSLLDNLDPHSYYVPTQEAEGSAAKLEGSFMGVGITFQRVNDTVSVIEVLSGGPAEKVGVLPGDRIIKVDDVDISGKDIIDTDVVKMLRGEKDTQVQITVRRATSRKPLVFDITRGEVPQRSIDAAYMIDDKIGYIKVSKFARNTYAEFLRDLASLRLDGAESYIIDLRGNTGGYMEPAILMANEFLGAGNVIVSTIGRNHDEDQYVMADGSGAFGDTPLVVLIDEFSASASEIFSGAIQDNDRGWIVGRRSFGKGLVQKPIFMPDSSEIRLTVQRYYTPAGRSIQKDYRLGGKESYETEIINRYNNGEILSADSVKLNTAEKFLTRAGRTVYGGGGIMPDYFVPNDTSGVSSYYINVVNHGLLINFAHEYADLNRADLEKAAGKDGSVNALLRRLPSDDVLLNSFVHYASLNGVPARWYYINISSRLIVNQLRALIARDILGTAAYYQVANRTDKTVLQGIEHMSKPLVE